MLKLLIFCRFCTFENRNVINARYKVRIVRYNLIIKTAQYLKKLIFCNIYYDINKYRYFHQINSFINHSRVSGVILLGGASA